MSKYKKGEKVLTPLGVGVVYAEEEFIFDLDEWHIRVVVGEKFGFNRVITFEVCDLKPYKSAHEKLLELGWKRVIFDDIYYEKFNERSRRTMAIRIPKDKDGYYVNVINMVIDLEMSKILTQYLEELENEK